MIENGAIKYGEGDCNPSKVGAPPLCASIPQPESKVCSREGNVKGQTKKTSVDETP